MTRPTKNSKKTRQESESISFQALEKRILLDGAAVATVADAALSDSIDHEIDVAAASVTTNEVVNERIVQPRKRHFEVVLQRRGVSVLTRGVVRKEAITKHGFVIDQSTITGVAVFKIPRVKSSIIC